MTSSGSHLLEIDERFCQCPICLQQYKEPKQLPCLHRYCSTCLQEILDKNVNVGVITCPECREQFEVPKNGVDGFKTDFNIKNVIEYIQLQKSLEDEQLRECCDCAKEIKVTAYCFKCNDFLCKDCHNTHVTKKILQDHKQHTLTLENIKSRNMTLEKLVALKEAPRCQDHPENLSQLCCRTCNNLPICLTCTYGSHEGHKIKDVHILATEEKKSLHEQLQILGQYKERMYKMSETVQKIRTDLSSSAKEKEEFYQTIHKRDVDNTEAEMENMKESTRIRESELKNAMEKKLTEAREAMEKELEEVRQKYENICDDIRKETETELGKIMIENEEQLQKYKDKLLRLDTESTTVINTIIKTQKERNKQLEAISSHIDSTVKRFENLTATSRSLLDTGNDWTAVQCIPDIRSASQPVSVEMRREFPELQSLSKIEIGVEIALEEESPIYLEGIKGSILSVNTIRDRNDGTLVVSGDLPENYLSHITVINTEGEVLGHKKLKAPYAAPYCICTYLSPLRVVTVSWADQIGVYNLSDDSYIEKKISSAIGRRFPFKFVKCITTDTVNNHILVGRRRCRYVYVFDDHLNRKRTVTLPYIIKDAVDITVSDGSLLVCDGTGRRAYAVNIEGMEGKLEREFTKPDIDGHEWSPFSVCTDRNRFVYMLWGHPTKSNQRCLLVQYSNDGRQVMAKKVDSDSRCITTVDTINTEKLVIGKEGNAGKLNIYDLRSPRVL